MDYFRFFAHFIFRSFSALFCDLVDQPFCILPAEARIRDRFSIDSVLIDSLASLFQIALDHHSLDMSFELRIIKSVKQDDKPGYVVGQSSI